MKKSPTIAHIHVWDTDNKGDVAIVDAVQEQLRNKFPDCTIVDYPIETLKTFDQTKLDELNAADVVIMGGGGILYRYFLPFNDDMLAKLTTPLVLFGVGYIKEIGATESSDEEKNSIVALTTKATLLAVRENHTKQLLIAWGVPEAKIHVIGDPAVLLSETAPSAEPELADVNIALNLNYSGWLGFGQYQYTILASYKAVADYFQQKHNAAIFYALHHPGEQNIYPKLGIKNMTVLDLTTQEQKYMYSKMDMLIGMMLHSCVMAFGARTPEINLGYDIRNKSFAEFINHPELHIPAPELTTEKLLSIATNVFENRTTIQQSFTNTISHIKSQHEDYLEKINQLLNT